MESDIRNDQFFYFFRYIQNYDSLTAQDGVEAPLGIKNNHHFLAEILY